MRRGVDGFQVVAGVLALVCGPLRLARGAPAGWSILLMADGCVVLSWRWIVVHRVEFDVNGRLHALVLVTGLLCIWLAVVYLTRAADDLPRLLPGHDGDSEHFRVVPGVVALSVGIVMLARAVGEAHPRRGDGTAA